MYRDLKTIFNFFPIFCFKFSFEIKRKKNRNSGSDPMLLGMREGNREFRVFLLRRTKTKECGMQ